jgi:hypothetical protein
MTRPKIYIETTIVGYLTAMSSRDLVTAALQQVTRDWWASRGAFDLFISQLVIDEASAGDPATAAPFPRRRPRTPSISALQPPTVLTTS